MADLTPFPDLPLELHHAILLHSLPPIVLNSPTFHRPSILETRATLLRFSLVSPLFARWSQKILLNSIHIDSVDTITSLLASLKAYENGGRTTRYPIRILRVGRMNGDGWSWGNDERIAFSALMNAIGGELHEARIVRCWGVQARDLDKAKDLKKLYMLNCSFTMLSSPAPARGPSTPDLRNDDGPVLTLPHLTQLYLTEVTFPVSLSSSFLTHNSFPSLTSLSFALNRITFVTPAHIQLIPNGALAHALPIPVLFSTTRSLSLSSSLSEGRTDEALTFLKSLRGLSTTDYGISDSVKGALGESLEVFDCWGHLLLLDGFKMVEKVPKSVKKLRLNFGGKAPESLPENLRAPPNPPPNPANDDDDDENEPASTSRTDEDYFERIPWMLELSSRMLGWLSESGSLSHIQVLSVPQEWARNASTGWNRIRDRYGEGRIRFEDRSIDSYQEWRDQGWSEESGKEELWTRMEQSSWDEGFWQLVDEVDA